MATSGRRVQEAAQEQPRPDLRLAVSSLRKISRTVGPALLVLLVLCAPTLGQSGMTIESHFGSEFASPGQQSTFVWEVTPPVSGPDRTLVASFHPPSGSNWEFRVEPEQSVIRAGESARLFRLYLTPPTYPAPRVLQGRFEILAVASTGVEHLTANMTVTATGTNLVLAKWVNPLPAPLDGTLGTFLLDVIAWLSIAILARLLVNPFLRLITLRTKTTVDDAMVGILATPVFVVIFAIGLKQSLEVFELPAWAYNALERTTYFVLVAVAIYIIYRVWREIVLHLGRRMAAKTKSQLDDRLLPVMEKIGGVIIILGGIFYAFASFGFNLTYFAAGGVLVTTVIAFAAQDTLSNFFGGVFLLIDQPFREEDDIIIESGEVCTVKRIGLRSTHLYHQANHEMIIVPNNQLASRRVINLIKPDRRYRLKVDVGVAYSSEIPKVRRVLTEIARAHPQVLAGGAQEPSVRVVGFGDSQLNLMLSVWIGDVQQRNLVASDLREAIHSRFGLEGIEIPFPHRVVLEPTFAAGRTQAGDDAVGR